MPYAAPNLPLNTTNTSWTELSSNFDDLRSYLNAIPVADVAARSVRREHLVAPTVRGYPQDRFESEVQLRGGFENGTAVSPGTSPAAWGARVERLTIVPRHVDPRVYLPLGWTLYTTNPWGLARQVEIEIHGSVQVRVDWNDPLTRYPDGAGAGAAAGRLEIRVRDRTTGIWVPSLAGACDLFPQDYATPPDGFRSVRGEPWRCVHVGDLVAGRVYDLVLSYVRDTAPLGIRQIDLSEITAKIAIS